MRTIRCMLLATIVATLGLWSYCAFNLIAISTRRVNVLASRAGVHCIVVSDSFAPFSLDIDAPRQSDNPTTRGIEFRTMSYANLPPIGLTPSIPWLSWPSFKRLDNVSGAGVG